MENAECKMGMDGPHSHVLDVTSSSKRTTLMAHEIASKTPLLWLATPNHIKIVDARYSEIIPLISGFESLVRYETRCEAISDMI